MTSYRTGLRAEKFAAWYLRLTGYRILEQRFKTPVGEIDLIAQRGQVTVFVEVKARGTMVNALYAVQPQQAQRIMRAAEYYMARYRGDGNTNIRFDVIAIALPFGLKHIRAAFQA